MKENGGTIKRFSTTKIGFSTTKIGFSKTATLIPQKDNIFVKRMIKLIFVKGEKRKKMSNIPGAKGSAIKLVHTADSA